MVIKHARTQALYARAAGGGYRVGVRPTCSLWEANLYCRSPSGGGQRMCPLFGGSKCIGIMGRSNGGSVTVRSREGVRSIERPSSEVLLYIQRRISRSA